MYTRPMQDRSVRLKRRSTKGSCTEKWGMREAKARKRIGLPVCLTALLVVSSGKECVDGMVEEVDGKVERWVE